MPTVGQKVNIIDAHGLIILRATGSVPENCPHRLHRGRFMETPFMFQWKPLYQNDRAVCVESVLGHEDINNSLETFFIQVTYGV